MKLNNLNASIAKQVNSTTKQAKNFVKAHPYMTSALAVATVAAATFLGFSAVNGFAATNASIVANLSNAASAVQSRVQSAASAVKSGAQSAASAVKSGAQRFTALFASAPVESRWYFFGV